MGRYRVLEMIDRPFLGGGQRNLLDLAANLDRSTFEVTVCSAAGGPLEGLLEERRIRFISLPLKKRLSRKIIKDIRILLRRENFDLLHTHGGVAGFSGRLAARRGPVCVHTLHGIHYLNYRNPLLKWMAILQERYLSRSTAAVICVSEADRSGALGYDLVPDSRLRVIKNGIDFESVKSSGPADQDRERRRAAMKIKPGTPLLGTVARLHFQKGIPDLLKAMDSVRREIPEARLVIVGGGPEENRVRKLIRELGLDQTVILLGERKDARELLSLFDVFVLSSLWEGLPYVLLEAAALAKPVISTAALGVAEVITDGENGLLVPVSKPEDLAKGAVKLLRDKDLAFRLGQNLRRNAASQFSLERMVSETADLYLKVLKERQV